MDAEPVNQVVELQLTYRYIKDHPWTCLLYTSPSPRD